MKSAIVGITLFKRRILLKDNACRPLFSERNRLGVSVIGLPFGYRLTIRKIDYEQKEPGD